MSKLTKKEVFKLAMMAGLGWKASKVLYNVSYIITNMISIKAHELYRRKFGETEYRKLTNIENKYLNSLGKHTK